MSFKACIFDLDGTLCDSVESIAWSANRALRDFGMREAATEQYKISAAAPLRRRRGV